MEEEAMTLSGAAGSTRAPSAVPVPHSLLDTARDAEARTRAANAALLERLPFHDRQDFEDARRGLVAAVPHGGVVRGEGGAMLWNLEEYGFLDAAHGVHSRAVQDHRCSLHGVESRPVCTKTPTMAPLSENLTAITHGGE
jgi:hypothetical protein